MPDIEMRLNRDMLVVSAPIDAVLERQGVDLERDLELFALLEPDSLHDALRLEIMAGAHCLVATTRRMTPARLAHEGMREQLPELACAALSIAASLVPQHLFVELEPCGLPFDCSSKDSLNEHRDQYARAARAFEAAGAFDAYLLSGFADAVELRCALMGIRQVSDRPLLASVAVRSDGTPAKGSGSFEDAFALMAEYGATVAGLRTAAGVDEVCALVERAARACDLPLLVELDVRLGEACRLDRRTPSDRLAFSGQGTPSDRLASSGQLTSSDSLASPSQHTPSGRFARLDSAVEEPYVAPDAMSAAAVRLCAAGAQFLRAVGEATPAYTGALAAVATGLDVRPARSAQAVQVEQAVQATQAVQMAQAAQVEQTAQTAQVAQAAQVVDADADAGALRSATDADGAFGDISRS